MAITEESRFRLYQRLKEAIGEDEATTLMEHLPPVGWADVATKRDIDELRTEMQHGFAAVRTELRTELQRVRADMGHQADANRLALESLGNQLRVEFHRGARAQFFGLIAANATTVGLAVAVAQLLH